MVSLWLSIPLAEAAPHFSGEPDDVALAALAWEAAARCTGREGSAVERVEIVRRTVAGDYLGVARNDPEGRLYRIELNTDEVRRREVLTHEITHAWISEGPVALVEGTAELLADCMSAAQHGLAPLQFDDGRSLSGLPDLVAWGKPVEGVPSELHAIRTDGYVGASRLVRTLALLVPPKSLFSAPRIDWSSIDAALAAAGPRGLALREALEGGAPSQRAALQDEDRDGLTAIAESWLGTSDQRFDTDGDGWWDGAPPAPPGARALPMDGTPICAAQSGGARPLEITAGGNLRGSGIPELHVWRAPGPGARPVLLSLAALPSAESTGGRWVTVEGDRAATGCRSDRTVTVWAEDPRFDDRIDLLFEELSAALLRAEQAFGPGPERIALAVGGERSAVEGEIVWLSSAEVDRALANRGTESIAALAVSLRRLWFAGDRDWSGAIALSRALMR